MTRIMKLCQKKRRNVKGKGCMADLSVDCRNGELRGLKSEEVKCWIVGIVTLKEPVKSRGF